MNAIMVLYKVFDHDRLIRQIDQLERLYSFYLFTLNKKPQGRLPAARNQKPQGETHLRLNVCVTRGQP